MSRTGKEQTCLVRQADKNTKNEVLPGIEPGLPEDTDANQNPE
jgi:hypothetical protein